ncbi:hypothetical protein JKF63_05021 [Porcisia hertigi]|uniref:Uncharacterized protein n=1 Tax=Porcisia hertigi TaxID=2761500 RepID=A0A836LB26_9TRYP|nr:hypothetical protein JKF63_05021 [Porcisia hertigi]
MTDQLTADLNILRELVLQHQHQQRLADEADERVNDPEVPSAQSPSTNAAAAGTTADKLRSLQQDLGTLTEQLHAEKAVSARLLLQHRCDAASLEELLDQVVRVTKQVEDLTSELAEWKQRCQAAEAAHVGCAGQYESVREQVECVQQRVTETQAQHAVLSSTLTEAQQLLSKLADEKAQLMDTLRSRDAALLQLSGVELDRDEARARAQAFEGQHAEWVAEVREYQGYFDSAREEYVRGVHHVIAVRQEHEALREALAQSEARCAQWEQIFEDFCMHARAGCASVRADAATDASVEHISSAVVAVAATEGDSAGSGSGSGPDASDHHADPASPPNVAFESLLEAKVADLALRLCDAQARAEAAEHTAGDLCRLSLADSTLLIYLKSLVCALRPQVDGLAEHNAQLQARLLAAESFTDALMQHVVCLGEAFAEEASQRCWLTASIARDDVTAKTCTAEATRRAIGCGSDVGVRSGGGGGSGTAQPPATPLSALTQSRRHRLRTTALGRRGHDS